MPIPFSKVVKKKSYLIVIILIVLIFASIALTKYLAVNQYNGYMEGEYRYIAPQFTGELKELSVERGSVVKKGQALFTLDLQPEADQLNQAKAKMTESLAGIVQAQADLALSQLTLQRSKILVKKGAIQQESLDNAINKYANAKAKIDQALAEFNAAQAALQQAEWTQRQKIITASVDGVIFDTYYLPGELVPATHPVLALLSPKDIKVIFFIPETRISSFSLQQKIAINCDGCIKNIEAHIVYIAPQAEYTPPVIFSNETRSKLVYRIEAFVPNALQHHLYPGLPITVKTKI